jgi:hypothetical protein
MFWLLLLLAWLLASAILGALVGRCIRVAASEDPQQHLCEGADGPVEPAAATSAPASAARTSAGVGG